MSLRKMRLWRHSHRFCGDCSLVGCWPKSLGWFSHQVMAGGAGAGVKQSHQPALGWGDVSHGGKPSKRVPLGRALPSAPLPFPEEAA